MVESNVEEEELILMDVFKEDLLVEQEAKEEEGIREGKEDNITSISSISPTCFSNNCSNACVSSIKSQSTMNSMCSNSKYSSSYSYSDISNEEYLQNAYSLLLAVQQTGLY